jgi:flagellar basal body-associated protein FliL
LGEKKRRPLIPIILIAVGLVILIGAVASIFLLSGSDDQQMTSNPDSGVPNPQIQRVDLTSAKGAFDDGTAVFVDVRGQVYYQDGHIPGAISIPLDQLEERLDELNKDDWILLYCT